MILVAAVVAVALFGVAFRLLKVWPVAAAVLGRTRQAAAVLTDAALDDDTKEREIRAASKWLLVRFFEITARAALVLAVPTVALFGFDLLGLAALEDVMAFLLRLEVILVAAVVLVVAGLIGR